MILLLEDQPLISLDLEEALHDLGHRHVRVMRSGNEALALLRHETPAGAILDLYLADGNCAAVLDALMQKSVPAVVYSGSERPVGWDATAAAGCIWIDKPASPETVATALIQKLAGA